jgi:16S rRNA processing protein RimM
MRYIPVGRVVAAHGIKGAVKFHYYNAAYDDFFGYEALFARQGSRYKELEPIDKRFHKGFFYLSFKGLVTPEEVFHLLNKELFVREEDLPCLGEGEYYDYRLIGLDVTDVKGVKIGTVKEIVHTRANDLLVISGQEEIFVPLVEEFVRNIDLKDRRITVDVDALSL